MAVLVTGAGGYIGSHMVLKLVEEGESVVTLDNYVTGFEWAISNAATRVEGEVGDLEQVTHLIETHGIESVIHFAGSIIVPESVSNPLKYYINNTAKTATLVKACVETGVDHFIFSSTAAVYGDLKDRPAVETQTLDPTSPYGRSKLMSEMMLRDVSVAHDLRHTILRYFNVAGADPKERTGQSTQGATHLIKVAVEAALGKRDGIEIFGDDYETPDGTCVRDYIHVSDLVDAHYLALQRLREGEDSITANVGYGRGMSVQEVLEKVRAVSGVDFKTSLAPRRPGDPASIVADSTRARREFDWVPRFDDLTKIVEHALRWERKLSTINSHAAGK